MLNVRKRDAFNSSKKKEKEMFSIISQHIATISYWLGTVILLHVFQ